MMAKLFFRLAKTRAMRWLVGAVFQRADFILPVVRVIDARLVMGFYHPKPSYCEHIVLVPKQAIPTFMHLIDVKVSQVYLPALITAAVRVVNGSTGSIGQWTFMVNGGWRQEVPQVHFHLFKEQRFPARAFPDAHTMALETVAGKAWFHPRPGWEVHIVLVPHTPIPFAVEYNEKEAHCIVGVCAMIGSLEQAYRITQKGYTLFFTEEEYDGEKTIAIHCTAGRRIV